MLAHASNIPDELRDSLIEIRLPDGDMRSRDIVSRSRRRPTGKYPSWKMGRMMQWESPAELNAFRLLDADPKITAYHEQPLTIRFALNGQTQTHCPDVLVCSTGKRELWEIQSRTSANERHVERRTRFLQDALPAFGFAYRVVLAEQLGSQPPLANSLDLLKYGRAPVDDSTRERIRLILTTVPSICWSSATDGELGPQGRAALCRLALEGVLTIDMTQRLSATTCFVWNGHSRGDWK
jgi:hypothetical protein